MLKALRPSPFHSHSQLPLRHQRLRAEAAELVDLAGETAETASLYGLEEKETRDFGQRCLLARRMLERGVRFVQVYSGDTNGWDAHNDVLKNHTQMCRATDQPVAALLTDLKRRGLWDDTLIIWGGEFGRTPQGEIRDLPGRDHHIEAFTMWMAGGGVKPGLSIGKTDEIAWGAVEDRVHVHDLHATLMQLLGFDHEKLTFRFQGRDFRWTDVHGVVVKKLMA